MHGYNIHVICRWSFVFLHELHCHIHVCANPHVQQYSSCPSPLQILSSIELSLPLSEYPSLHPLPPPVLPGGNCKGVVVPRDALSVVCKAMVPTAPTLALLTAAASLCATGDDRGQYIYIVCTMYMYMYVHVFSIVQCTSIHHLMFKIVCRDMSSILCE